MQRFSQLLSHGYIQKSGKLAKKGRRWKDSKAVHKAGSALLIGVCQRVKTAGNDCGSPVDVIRNNPQRNVETGRG